MSVASMAVCTLRMLCCCTVIFAGFALGGCRDEAPPLTGCLEIQSEDHFFPKGTLDPKNARSDSFLREWFSMHLRAMCEPSLSSGNAVEAVRFTWLRSFHAPVSIRVEISGGAGSLHAIELDGAGGYEPGVRKREVHRQLATKDVSELKALLRETDIARLPPAEETVGLDGSRWIIETATGDEYHVVNRWTPERGPVRRVGEHMLELSGWSFADMY